MQERDSLGKRFDFWALRIWSTCFVLSIFLTIIRVKLTRVCCESIPPSIVEIIRTALTGYYDVIYLGIVACFFLSTWFLFRNSRMYLRFWWGLFNVIVLFSLVAGYLNVTIVRMLGRPFNYQWLYYSDFLQGVDTWNSILALLSWKLLLMTIALVAGVSFLARFLNKALFSLFERNPSTRKLLLLIPVLTLIYLAVAYWWIQKGYVHRFRLENPVVALASSLITAGQTPRLFTMETDWSPEDYRICKGREGEESATEGNRSSQVQNVVVFVLESVAAQYVEPYGGRFPVTPELARYRSEWALFENFYAHVPATNYSLISILKSIYPRISYKTMTGEPISVPSLSEELRKYGYRTAFMNSGDNRFQDAERFLVRQNFDRIEDRRTLKCNGGVFASGLDGTSLLDGTDDDCLVDAFAEWHALSPDQPFLAVLWTMMTHYPYFVSGEENDFGVEDESFNRYLNALRHGDRVFGRLMQLLEERNLKESTLVVVVGDHGEAFGHHGQYVHANRIYEENLHVPLIMIHSESFQGDHHSAVGGLVDLAPTILDVLDLPAPELWQGCSMFDSRKADRVYFFALWSSILFGYREGNMKFIFDSVSNQAEIYDLSRDPMETTNLVHEQPGLESFGVGRLAGWVQYQNRFVDTISEKQK